MVQESEAGLPTESEWEYSYRAGSVTAFYPSAGNDGTLTETGKDPLDPNVDQIGWYGGNSTATYARGIEPYSTTCALNRARAGPGARALRLRCDLPGPRHARRGSAGHAGPEAGRRGAALGRPAACCDLRRCLLSQRASNPRSDRSASGSSSRLVRAWSTSVQVSDPDQPW